MMDRLAHRGPDDAGELSRRPRRAGVPPAVDRRPGRRPSAALERGRHGLDGLQRRDLQLPRAPAPAGSQGARASLEGDTEVLVHLYEDEGTGMFSLLRGMFALAIWDAPPPHACPGARPAGTEAPGLSPRRLAAGLRQRAEGAAGPARSATSRAGSIRWPSTSIDLWLRAPPRHDPRRRRTSFRPPITPSGTTARLRIERYWSPDWNRDRVRPVEDDVEELRATLADAVREQMVADVPLGAFLSGGIDSTIIVGLMQQASSRPVKTFAIGFPDPALRRNPLRRAGRAAPGHRAPDVHASSRRPGRRCHCWPGSSTSPSPTARRCRPGTWPARLARPSPWP